MVIVTISWAVILFFAVAALGRFALAPRATLLRLPPPYKNWNARCAECHATGFVKNYDARARAYDSRQAEIGVGCEACHRPGEAHVAWAKAPEGYVPILAATGNLDGVRAALDDALAVNPSSEVIHSLYGKLSDKKERIDIENSNPGG